MWIVDRGAGDSETQRKLAWTAAMLNASVATAKLIGCSPEAIVGQAALESGWGAATIGNNAFGIKADSRWTGPKQCVTTREYRGEYPNGYYETIQDWFRTYDNLGQSIQDHFEFLKDNANYKNIINPDHPFTDQEYFQMLQADGYATDPHYAATLNDMGNSVRYYERTHMTVVPDPAPPTTA